MDHINILEGNFIPCVYWSDVPINKNITYALLFVDFLHSKQTTIKSSTQANYYIFEVIPNQTIGPFQDNIKTLLHIPINSFLIAWQTKPKPQLDHTKKQNLIISFSRLSHKRIIIYDAILE